MTRNREDYELQESYRTPEFSNFYAGSRNSRSAGSGSSADTDSGLAVPSNNSCFTRKGFTPFEKATHELNHDEKWAKEVMLGRRVSFYQFKSDIGSGNFSQVKSAVHVLTKDKVAVKILDKTKLDHKTQKMLSREIANMDKLVHPNIIRLFQVVETLTRIHLIMEFAGGGDLYTHITFKGKLVEDEAKLIFSQVASAVDYMHKNHMAHRDVKAENVFYMSPRWVKLGDFGFSISIANQDQQLKTFCGSPPYAAPELFQDDSYSGPPVDMWALGVLLYFIVVGLMPFRAQTVPALKKLIISGSYNIPSEGCSTECQDLILSLLLQDPRTRPTAAEIKSHPWLVNAMNGNCDTYCSDKDLIENLALKEVAHLGITEKMLSDAGPVGSRSPVVGIYRIIVSKLLNKRFLARTSSRSLFSRSSDPMMRTNTSDATGNANKRGSVQLQKFSVKSKACLLQ